MASPYITLHRDAWAAKAHDTEIELDHETLVRSRGFGEPTSLTEVEQVYRPLTQLIHLYREQTGRLYDRSNEFLGVAAERTPFVIGVAGSVAVGKSTTSRLLRELLRRAPGRPKVELVTTDGFLYPNETLAAKGLLERKGFPESYDRRQLLKFVMQVKSGAQSVQAPVYSHHIYDIVPGEQIVVTEPDILIIEGLNVLQPARVEADGRAGLAVSDFFDFTVYVDAAEADIKQWFTTRFLALWEAAFHEPDSFFQRFTNLTRQEAEVFAGQVWEEINGPNLRQNILPTRERATAILRKGEDHTITEISIRKI